MQLEEYLGLVRKNSDIEEKLKWIFQAFFHDRRMMPGDFVALMRSIYEMSGEKQYFAHQREAILLFRKMDNDNDCKVNIQEFIKVSKETPEFIELLDSCNYCAPDILKLGF